MNIDVGSRGKMLSPVLLFIGLLLLPCVGLSEERADEILVSIRERIEADQTLGPKDMTIEVGRGRAFPPVLQTGELDRHVVRLAGTVSSEQDRQRIREIAEQTPWVRRVENQLRVGKMNAAAAARPSLSTPPLKKHPIPDSELVARVRDALRTVQGIDSEVIGIQASQGTVWLSGSFDSHRQIDSILSEALMVPGVEDVRSAMTIEGREYPKSWRQ